MIETQIQMLHEIVSSLAKKFEEEKMQMEAACATKDAELAAGAEERQQLAEQLAATAGDVRSLGEQLDAIREENSRLAAEGNALRDQIHELKRVHREELEIRDRMREEELAKASEMIEIQIKSLDQKVTDERMRWREVLRSN